jgi:hypothetical protein
MVDAQKPRNQLEIDANKDRSMSIGTTLDIGRHGMPARATGTGKVFVQEA